ncbi:MAG: pilus assembly protein TadG-related protein [Aquihabitans sp.]
MRRMQHHHRSPDTAARRTGERGVIVPMVAMSMVTILLIVTLVLDGSQAYPQRRSAQNAADAAAQAGTQQLDKAKFFTPALDPFNPLDPALVASTAKIYTRALDTAKANGAISIECWLIRGDGTPLIGDPAAIRCQDAVSIMPTAPWVGVRIRASVDRATTFRGIGGTGDKVTARAVAAATVQKLIGTASPFIVCADPNPLLVKAGEERGINILRTDALGNFIYNADGTVSIDPVKAAALKVSSNIKPIYLQGSKVAKCNAGDEFKGLNANVNDPVIVPGVAPGQNGNSFVAEVLDQVVGANPCPPGGPYNGCDLILPLTVGSTTPGGIQMKVVAFIVMSVTENSGGNPRYEGKYLGTSQYLSSGTTNMSPALKADLRVIRLVE